MNRILLIEDNELNLDLTVRYLEHFAYEVRTATDGVAGLELAITEHADVDLILLDMNLPEMDGWEVARRLKAHEATKSIPVVALTAHAMVGDREKTLAAGCDEYASKPVDFQSLLQKIQNLISKAAV